VGITTSTLRAPFSAKGSKDTGLITNDIVNSSGITKALSKNGHSSSIKQEPPSSSQLTLAKFDFSATGHKMAAEHLKVYFSI